MNDLVPLQATSAVATQGPRREGLARAAAALPETAPWRRAQDERQTAWNVWRATRPAAGYVVHRLTQDFGNDSDPALRLRGQAAYAAQAARAMSIAGPAGTVSLLV